MDVAMARRVDYARRGHQRSMNMSTLLPRFGVVGHRRSFCRTGQATKCRVIPKHFPTYYGTNSRQTLVFSSHQSVSRVGQSVSQSVSQASKKQDDENDIHSYIACFTVIPVQKEIRNSFMYLCSVHVVRKYIHVHVYPFSSRTTFYFLLHLQQRRQSLCNTLHVFDFLL